MLGKIGEMKKERESMAIEVEMEEELITNNMNRRLAEANSRAAAAEANMAAAEEARDDALSARDAAEAREVVLAAQVEALKLQLASSTCPACAIQHRGGGGSYHPDA